MDGEEREGEREKSGLMTPPEVRGDRYISSEIVVESSTSRCFALGVQTARLRTRHVQTTCAAYVRFSIPFNPLDHPTTLPRGVTQPRLLSLFSSCLLRHKAQLKRKISPSLKSFLTSPTT